MLQWSHVFSNVEILEQSWKRDGEGAASMEPRFFKRGNKFSYYYSSVFDESFNGATFFQTWKCH